MYIRPFIDNLSCNNITIQQPGEVGSVYIDSVPLGANICINEVEQICRLTPGIIDELPSSPTGIVYRYKLTYPGYVDAKGYIFIKTGETYPLSVIMERITRAPSDIGKMLMFALGIGAFLFFLSKKDR